MKLEVKKIDKKINLDTTTEGCTKDCIEHKYVAYSEETSMNGTMNCAVFYTTAKGNIFFYL